MFLFDSRFHYAYSADGFPEGGVRLNFDFKEKQRIEQIKIWNGFQMSLRLCLNNARAKTMVVRGDNGYEAKLDVADVMGGQVLKLPKPFTGKHLELHITEVYKGWFYKDLVISELRFSDGKDWLIMNPLPDLQKTTAYFKETFRKAGIDGLLNRSLLTAKELGGMDQPDFTLRLRSDGSVYFDATAQGLEAVSDKEGNYTGSKLVTSYYSALGMYEIKESSSESVKIRVFGSYRLRQTKQDFDFGGDCNGCGTDCNILKSGGNESLRQEKIFQEFFTLRKKGGGYQIVDYSPKPQFGFAELSLRHE
ncbi:MAG: hypothetical protein LDLANPLL_00198 [Turneriella sp.]|nr:hypothetical protein [Turneriella sp.]